MFVNMSTPGPILNPIYVNRRYTFHRYLTSGKDDDEEKDTRGKTRPD